MIEEKTSYEIWACKKPIITHLNALGYVTFFTCHEKRDVDLRRM